MKYHFDNKGDFRRSCIKQLKKSAKFAKCKKDIFICKKLEKIIQNKKVKNVLVYIPFGFEVNVLPLIYKLRSQGMNVYVPFISGETFIAVRFRLPLKINSFKIKEPSVGKSYTNLDLAIVPIVGVDSCGARIGYGKGMYDRFFETLQKKPFVVFVQRELCENSLKLSESFDIKANYIVTY